MPTSVEPHAAAHGVKCVHDDGIGISLLLYPVTSGTVGFRRVEVVAAVSVTSTSI